MLKLNNKDRDIINYLGYPKVVELSCGRYLIKRINMIDGIKELLGSFIGKQFNINVPNNNIVNIENNWYLLSEDLNKLGNFIPASAKFELGKEDISLTEVWQILEENENYDANLVYNVVKIYMFDILFKNTDRRLDNWGFIKKSDNSEQVVMFDFENCLDFSNDKSYLHSYDDKNDYLSDFEYFLSVSSEEYSELFQKYYTVFTPNYIANIVNEIMKENNIIDKDSEEKLINSYSKNYEVLKEVLNKQRGR